MQETEVMVKMEAVGTGGWQRELGQPGKLGTKESMVSLTLSPWPLGDLLLNSWLPSYYFQPPTSSVLFPHLLAYGQASSH